MLPNPHLLQFLFMCRRLNMQKNNFHSQEKSPVGASSQVPAFVSKTGMSNPVPGDLPD